MVQAQDRIKRNFEKLKAGKASQQQINDYIAMEAARSGPTAVESARKTVFDSGKLDTSSLSGFVQSAVENPLRAASKLAGFNTMQDTGQAAQEIATNVARDVKENPARTVLGAAGGIGGAAIGSRFGGVGTIGLGALGAAGGEQVGESIDNAIFNRESRSVGERAGSALTTAGITAAVPLVGGAVSRVLAKPATEAVETQAAKVGGATAKALQNVFGKEKNDLILAAEQTALGTKPLGTGSARGVVVAEKANLLFDADRATDAVEQINKRNNIVRSQIAGGIPAKDVAVEASKVGEQATKALEKIQQTQKETNKVFAVSKSNRPANFTAKEVNDIFNDEAIVGALKAAGGEDAAEQFKRVLNIPLTVTGAGGRATQYRPTERDITAAIANLTQEAGKNPQVEAVFWRNVYEDKLKPMLKSKGDELSKRLLNQFEQRFALFRSRQPLGQKLYSGDIGFVQDALASPQAFDDAMKVWKDAVPSTNFQRYAKNAILAKISNPDGTVVSSKLTQFLNATDPKTIDKALGAGYYQKLKDVATARAAIETAGVETQVLQAARGLQATETAQEALQGALISGITGPVALGSNALGTGARIGAFTQKFFRGVAGQGNSFQDATVRSFVENALKAESAQATYPAYVALASSLGTPVISAAEYAAEMENLRSMQDAAAAAGQRVNNPIEEGQAVFDLEKELESIRSGEPASSQGGVFDLERELEAIRGGGQGGPEETAPSMAPERDIAALINPRSQDPIGDLIRQTEEPKQPSLGQFIDEQVDRDDFDKMIRQAMIEEMNPVSKKLTTRNEEGFEPRVYKDTMGFRTVGIGFNMDAPGARGVWKQAGMTKSFDQVLNGKQTLTNQEAETLFQTTKDIAVSGARRLVKNYDQLGVHQQAALQDMVFQLGQAGAMQFATTRGLIEKGQFAAAARQMLNSRNFRQTPNRVLRRAYMLEHNVSLAEADAALVRAGKISTKESITPPKELSRLMNQAKPVAAANPAPTPAVAATQPKKRKRVTYAQAKANKGIA